MRAVSPADWLAMENSIAQLLPSSPATHDRGRLLATLATYSRAVVAEARLRKPDRVTAEETSRALTWLCHPVFVCGHHRSGTTLLQQLLDGHPQLIVLPSEGTYFTSFAYAARGRPSSQDVDGFCAEWIARLVDPNQEPHFKLGRSHLSDNPSVRFVGRLLGWRAALVAARPELARFGLLLALAAAYRDTTTDASRGSPVMWVEKTPLNERHVRRFSDLPEARFIHVVREPQATLASLLARYRAADARQIHLSEQAQSIRQSLQLAHANARRLGAPHYLVVRYEDLVDDPAHEIERVRAFLGITAHASLRTPTVAGQPVRSNSAFEPSAAGAIQRRAATAALSLPESGLIATVSAAPARRLGYGIAPPSASRACAIWLRHWAALGLRRVATRISRAIGAARRGPRHTQGDQ